MLKLIDRGQYSKNDHLSETVAFATSTLSYVEPSLVLPFLASRFHMALETVSSLTGITLDGILVPFSQSMFTGYDGIVKHNCFCLSRLFIVCLVA